jgi:flagellar operon protein
MVNAIDRLPPIARPSPVAPVAPKDTQAIRGGGTEAFHEILDKALTGSNGLSFSSHAQSRLLSRQILLSNEQMARLQHGVEQAAEKGARDSLVMLDNLAFIVSVSNRKVVTALDGATRTGNVFTQIDSAVIV